MNLAILAGAGKLPGIAAREARAAGHTVQIFYAKEENITEPEKDSQYFSILRFGELIHQLVAGNTTHVLLLGKVRKEHLFTGGQPDALTAAALSTIDLKNDDALFFLILRELEKAKIQVIEQPVFLQSLLLPAGTYTKRQLSETENKDVIAGLQYARGLGSLDIGQSVVVSLGAVMAVEAIEGTDECIRRAGKYAHGHNLVFCKAEKKHQDKRFDIPAIGTDTLKVMKEANCHVVAIEANKTFVITPDEFISECDTLGIAFVSV